MAHSSQLNMVQNLRSMVQEPIIPEPECTSFMKYMAKHFNETGDVKEAIVHLVNSHGLQLRSDLKYQCDKREENAAYNSKTIGPVLDVANFKLYDNFDDIVGKIKELPDEWTVIQITKRFIPMEMLKEVRDNQDPGLFIIRFNCGKIAERIPPYYVAIDPETQPGENFMQLLEDLFKTRREYFTSGGTSRKIKEEYANTDAGLMKCMSEMENHWLKEWRCLLGGRLQDKMLEYELRQQVKMAVDNFAERSNWQIRSITEDSYDMIFQATLSAHLLQGKEILMVLNRALITVKEGEPTNMVSLVEDLKRISMDNLCIMKRADRYPVILVLDKPFELIPWEMVSTIISKPVCRISSLHLLYSLFKFHEGQIVEGYRVIPFDSGYCLLNPDRDLNECEREITRFLSTKMPWIESEVGKIPESKSLVAKFENFNVFFYCGHGSGTQYIKCCDLKKAIVKGLVLLFGCSSNLPKSAGGRTPYYNDTYTYILNGCPCLIGCIYDITSSDADIACKEMLTSFLPTLNKNGMGIVVEMPSETDVLKGVIVGKEACKKYWSRCAFVARGIPCRTTEGRMSYLMNY